MRRRVLFVIVAIALLCCVLGALVACESYKTTPLDKVGDPTATVESNGGLVVKQGGYLYFVNGYTGYLTENGKDNWFGNVVKGAIVRVTYNEDKTLGDDAVVVVPKSVMASSANVGFSIFGEYIYYVSPSAVEDRAGKVQTDTLQFMRTKIDRTGTEVILNIEGNTSVDYKYTSTALIHYDSSDKILYSKDLTKKSFKESDKGTVIAEDVASVHFPKNDSYAPATPTTAADYVFYTKSSEDAYEYGNTLYVASPDGSVNKAVIGPDTFDEKYSISIVASDVEDGKVTIYYTKTAYIGTSSSGTVEGTYAYTFTDASFTFNKAQAVKLTSDSLSSVFPAGSDLGLIVYGSSTNTIRYDKDGELHTYGELQMSTLVAVEDGYFYYVNGDSKLLAFAMSDDENAKFAYDGDDKVMTSFTGAEYFDGYLYFIVDDDYDYVSRLKVSTISVTDPSSVEYDRIGIVTDADQEKIKAAEEKKDED